MDKEEIMGRIMDNRKKIKEFGVKKLTLFGSYVSGNQKENSDIDFLVEFEKNRGLFDDYAGLLAYLEDLLGKNIDLGEEKLLKEELKPSILGGNKIEAEI